MAGPLQRLSHTGAAVSSALVGNLSLSGLGFVLTVNNGWPTGAGGPFGVVVDPGLANEEHVLCATQSSGNVVVTSTGRGYDGTIAYTHVAGAVVEHIILAAEVDDANAHIYDATRRDHSMYAPLDGSAAFTGLVTFNAGITDTGPLTQTGPVVITGNESVSGTLGVGGATTLGAGVSVTGNAAVTGNATVGGTATVTGLETAQALALTGLTGAVTPSRYVGGTASGAPTSGAFLVGDFVIAANGSLWICTTAGSPGTWAAVNPVSYPQGEIASGTGPAVLGLYGSSPVPVMTLVAPLVSGRRYKMSAYVIGSQQGTSGSPTSSVTDSAGYLPSNLIRPFEAPSPIAPTVAIPGACQWAFVATSTGNDTFTLNVSVAGAGAVQIGANNAQLIVEDIGT